MTRRSRYGAPSFELVELELLVGPPAIGESEVGLEQLEAGWHAYRHGEADVGGPRRRKRARRRRRRRAPPWVLAALGR